MGRFNPMYMKPGKFFCSMGIAFHQMQIELGEVRHPKFHVV
jgi:hypothetical protein